MTGYYIDREGEATIRKELLTLKVKISVRIAASPSTLKKMIVIPNEVRNLQLPCCEVFTSILNNVFS
jgi:hypothetical protein